jgi:hypothetical protein
MALVPSAAPHDPDVYERSGLFLIRHAGSTVVVDARPGSPPARSRLAKFATYSTGLREPS